MDSFVFLHTINPKLSNEEKGNVIQFAEIPQRQGWEQIQYLPPPGNR